MGYLFNKDKTIGMTSADVALLQYDVAEDEVLKNKDGFCKKVSNHKPGLLIVKIGLTISNFGSVIIGLWFTSAIFIFLK